MQVFIDESGNHSLDPKHVEALYSVFVLGAVCFEDADYERFDKKFRRFKEQLFGTDEYIVHTAEITRPGKSKDPLTARFYDPGFRARFYGELSDLVARSRFQAVACVVRKEQLEGMPGNAATDPYLYSFDFILNRVIRRCRKGEQCCVYPEKRRPAEDIKL